MSVVRKADGRHWCSEKGRLTSLDVVKKRRTDIISVVIKADR